MASLPHLLDELPEPLRRQALTHASWVSRRADSYDRLAFLGDVVLSLAISTHLFPRFVDAGAGRLTKLRAQVVSRGACAQVARDMEVPARMLAVAPEGAGRAAELLLESDRVLASVCEAVIGACYEGFGFERVSPAIVAAFAERIDQALEHPEDFKSVLQERLARRGDIVEYRIEEEAGPPHDREFIAVAEVLGRPLGRGSGKTKKSAEQAAALQALQRAREGVAVAGGNSA